jgi:CheY-like chemotaxis protein
MDIMMPEMDGFEATQNQRKSKMEELLLLRLQQRQ